MSCFAKHCLQAGLNEDAEVRREWLKRLKSGKWHIVLRKALSASGRSLSASSASVDNEVASEVVSVLKKGPQCLIDVLKCLTCLEVALHVLS